MHTLSGAASGAPLSLSPLEILDVTERAKFDARRPRYTLIVILWLISVPVATIVWLAGLTQVAIWLVELVQS
jgi:hypothetical protein